jgi:two-component system cell cycle response regulator
MDIAPSRSSASPRLLLASAEPALLTCVEPAFGAVAARVEVAVTAEAALAAIARADAKDLPLDLVLVDAALPGMATGQLLAAIRASESRPALPLILIADTVNQEWLERLADGVIDDLILRNAEAAYWQIRVERTLRAQRLAYELDHLRGDAARNAQLDRLTGVYNRDAMLSMLFRETDRVQRMSSAMCLILFDIDDFGHWNSRLGGEACDEMLCQVAARTSRLLRSYDMVGRMGNDEFMVALPGCAPAHAEMLAERLRLEVFSTPLRVRGDAIRLSACFGIASSQGRSPVVVLREAEQALERARMTGPEAIQCFGEPVQEPPAPVAFLSSTSGDELLAW